MGNIKSYLDWRGDLTFQGSPFNEVDNLILAQFAYVDLKDIVPDLESEETITIEEASDMYFRKHEERELKQSKSFTRMTPFLMREMAKTVRFKNAKLGKYVDRIDKNKQEQFAAIKIYLEDGSIYIAFRGTDDTIIGWKEDFNMSFVTVPAQLEAVEYLEKVVKGRRRNYRVGGHSKGGNLAIYAATQCSNRVKKKIMMVYNNDGPGFTKEVITTRSYEEMVDRIVSIVPESSVIGMLLEHGETYKIVASSQKGILQHDAMTWQVMGNQFVIKKQLTKESQLLDETIKMWLENLEIHQKEEFVDSLFSVLEATGAHTLTDISNGGMKSLSLILRSFSSLNSETKEIITRLIRLLRNEYSKELLQPILRRREKISKDTTKKKL